jgi:hypothetical protein
MTAHKLLKQLVGASGFEPEASCAQGRQPSLCKSFDFALWKVTTSVRLPV